MYMYMCNVHVHECNVCVYVCMYVYLHTCVHVCLSTALRQVYGYWFINRHHFSDNSNTRALRTGARQTWRGGERCMIHTEPRDNIL